MKDRMIAVRDILFTMHLLVYGFVGFLVFASTAGGAYMQNPMPAIFVFWTAFFFLHTRSHFLNRGQGSNIRDERQAYRDGFNDAIRMMRDEQEVPNRLMLDSDGELVEELAQGKRKYR